MTKENIRIILRIISMIIVCILIINGFVLAVKDMRYVRSPSRSNVGLLLLLLAKIPFAAALDSILCTFFGELLYSVFIFEPGEKKNIIVVILFAIQLLLGMIIVLMHLKEIIYDQITINGEHDYFVICTDLAIGINFILSTVIFFIAFGIKMRTMIK